METECLRFDVCVDASEKEVFLYEFYSGAKAFEERAHAIRWSGAVM